MVVKSCGLAGRHRKRRQAHASADLVSTVIVTTITVWGLRDDNSRCRSSATGPCQKAWAMAVAQRTPLTVVWFVVVPGGAGGSHDSCRGGLAGRGSRRGGAGGVRGV